MDTKEMTFLIKSMLMLEIENDLKMVDNSLYLTLPSKEEILITIEKN